MPTSQTVVDCPYFCQQERKVKITKYLCIDAFIKGSKMSFVDILESDLWNIVEKMGVPVLSFAKIN